MSYYSKENIQVESIRIYKHGTTQSIDCLVEDYRLFESSLDNSFTPISEYYSSISAGFVNDTEELGEQKLLFVGDVDQLEFRRIASFLSIPNQRYRLEVKKNGVTYYRFFKRGASSNKFTNNRQFNRYEKELLCETLWLKNSDIIEIDNRPNNPNAGSYNIDNYEEVEYATDSVAVGSSYSFTPESEGLIFWQLQATTSGGIIEISINDDTITTLVEFEDGKAFEYENIPFYSKALVDNISIVPEISKSGKIFETYLKPFEKNTIAVNGLKDLKFIYVTAYEVI